MAGSFQSSTDHSSRPQSRSRSDLRNALEQGLADAPASILGKDEQVFQIHAGLGQERRIAVEEQRVTDGRSIEPRDQHFRVTLLAEERVSERMLGRDARCESFSYSARPRMNERIVGTSRSVAAEISTEMFIS